ncbi:MAG: hypothetical protein KAH00_06235 [Cocleimonas sp.]|nr:hypothetical protein [Cocleimonas sp.]
MSTLDLNTQITRGRHEAINSGPQNKAVNAGDAQKFINTLKNPDSKIGDASPKSVISGGSININGVTIGGSNDPDAFRGSLEGMTQTGNDALLAGNYQGVFEFTDKYLRNSPAVIGTNMPVSTNIAISYQLVAKAGLEADAAIKQGDGAIVAGSVLTAIDEFEFLGRIGVEGATGMSKHFQGILSTLNPSDVATAKGQFKESSFHFGR